jgi:hypothetical protein
MTPTGSDHNWTLTNVANGTVVRYFFTIGQNTGAVDTAWTQFTLNGNSSSSSGGFVTSKYINAGGSATSPFVADTGFSPTGTVGSTTSAINTALVSTPVPAQSVLQTWRQHTSTLTYTVSGFLPNTGKTVSLLFSENTYTAANQRKFDVYINGVKVLGNFDIYANTGARYKAIQENFNATSSTSGQFVIQFVPITGAAMINGIEIE